jgi:glutathione S-transferase
MPARLYCFELSHPSQVARLALRLKGVPFEERILPAGLHSALLRLSGFAGGTVPGLKLEDGRRLQSSVEITRVLDELVPGDPVLHPSAEVTEAEHWAEAELQPAPRRIFRWAAVRQLDVREFVSRMSGLPAPRASARLAWPIARRMAAQVGATDDGVQRELQLLPERLDRVDALLASGVIGGETLNAADLQIGCSVRSLLTFAQLEPLLAGRPCEAHARRVLPDAPEPVPARLPDEWLSPARERRGRPTPA